MRKRSWGVLHLLGAVLMYQLYTAPDFAAFYPYVLAYMIAYMPTLALVNSVAFRQMKDPSKEFSKVRVWGTIGWIVAGLVISYLFSWDSSTAIAEGMLKNTFFNDGYRPHLHSDSIALLYLAHLLLFLKEKR